MSPPQPLNFAPKVIAEFDELARVAAPLSRLGFGYLAEKLRQAQVFVLPDHGVLLDRGRPRPELPGLVLRPPFPVVALEYMAPADTGRSTPGYTDAPSSKRIALAWEWSQDLPPALARWCPQLGEGVAVASLAFFDHTQRWMPVSGAVHYSYDAEWITPTGPVVALQEALISSGTVPASARGGRVLGGGIIPLLPEGLEAAVRMLGPAATLTTLSADLMDEANAYSDLCYALACGNVAAERHSAPSRLNEARAKAGKLPLFDYHVLTLGGAGEAGGQALGGPREGPRAHLRRGHIRRLDHLGAGRMTWVNASMVRGRESGFVDKTYAVRSVA